MDTLSEKLLAVYLAVLAILAGVIWMAFRERSLARAIAVDDREAQQTADGSRFRIVNEFRRADGELAARVTSLGGWFDLAARKLVPPPEPLEAAMRALERTAEFGTLPSSIR